jgi:myo-inositol 2-dehydrogenase / D-chiro-inositol 1-dehydrogenase
MTEEKKNNVSRRSFIAGTGASALGLSIVKPETAFGASANSKVKLGMIACGGRGTWISKLFDKHGGYELVAAADYFEDRVTGFGDLFDIPQAHRFVGLSGYKRMLDANLVDAIAIESPPYFHPEQAAAGVDAGVHVYVAKPIAVDVPGCVSIEASGQKARSKKLCFLIDFQTRANDLYSEALRRVRDGALGTFAFGESTYHAGTPWSRQFEYWKEAERNPEMRLRAWGLDKVLSGDIITEQNIHTLDVCSWIMDSVPERAWGTCGNKVRGVGDCSDTFTITFQYPNNIGIAFSSRQFEGYQSSEGIRNRMFGSDGVLETEYGGTVLIRGKKPFEGGNTGNIFTDGAATNIAAFHTNIVNGDFSNPTVEPSVQSNLTTILGRTAAYRNEEVSWAQMMKENETLTVNLQGMKE